MERVGVVPQPPLFVPDLVAGQDPEVQRVRDECLSVARELVTAAPRWIAIGADSLEHPTLIDPPAAGTFRGYGVDVQVHLSTDGVRPTEADPAMPLPALIAGWLRERAGAEDVSVWMIPSTLPAADCQVLGEGPAAELDGDERVGPLVIGDG